MFVTRLDRLVVLLETGSTTLVRNTAAQQLADIQKQHPHELYNLLARVAPYLQNREWECRVAAGRAVGGIAENVPQWDPNSDDSMQDIIPENILDPIKEEDDIKLEISGDILPTQQNDDDDADCRLCFKTFDPLQVVRYGEKLLGSAGKVNLPSLPSSSLDFRSMTLREISI
jgi:TATA-binding protein-associated factor